MSGNKKRFERRLAQRKRERQEELIRREQAERAAHYRKIDEKVARAAAAAARDRDPGEPAQKSPPA